MSWIIDRLKRVEGASSSRGLREERSAESSSPVRGDQLARSGGAPPGGALAPSHPGDSRATLPRRLNLQRLIAGLLVVFAVFIAWRSWRANMSGRPASGQRVAARTADVHPRAEQPHSPSVRQPQPRAPAPPADHSQTAPLETGAGVKTDEKQWAAAPPAAEAPKPPPATDTSPPPGQELAVQPGPQQTMHKPRAADSLAAGVSAPATQLSSEDAITASSAGGTTGQILSPQEDERTKTFLLDLKVSGVYKSANGYMALINGREFQKGGKIQRIEIVQIGSSRITFAYKGKRYHLPIR